MQYDVARTQHKESAYRPTMFALLLRLYNLQGTPRSTPLEQLAESLKAAAVPTGGSGGLGRGAGRAGRGGRGGGRGRGGRGRGGRSGGRRRRSDGSSSDEGGMDVDEGYEGMAGAAAAGYGAAGYGQYPGYGPGQQWQL